MPDVWIDRLSEWLDGDLSPVEQAACAAHLAQCATCRALLEDLARVRQQARTLAVPPLERDLWPGVAAALGGHAPSRRPVPRRPRLLLALAASVALLAAGGAGWLLARRAADPRASVASRAAAEAPLATRDAGYRQAVDELTAALERGRRTLDPRTVRVLEENLAVIDRALAEAEAALARDPANHYLHGHLSATMRRKLTLLREAARLAART